MVITIDGLSETRKSAVGTVLAGKLHFRYVDSSSIYRAVAYKVWESKIDIENEDRVSQVFRNNDIEQEFSNGIVKTLCNGIDISEIIKTPLIDSIVPIISSQSGVRYHVTAVMHVWGCAGNIIIVGKDIGTSVFPNADFKFFLTASTNIRAQRRQLELQTQGQQVSLETIEQQVIEQDRQDEACQWIKLKPAKDAIIIDTSDKSVDEVVGIINDIIRK